MKKALCIVMVSLMAFSMVGCSLFGGSGTATGEAETFPDYDPSQETTIYVGNPDGDLMTPDEIFENFQANSNIKLDIDTTPWGDYLRKNKTQLAAGNPAVVFISDSGYCSSLGGKGAVVNLSAVVERDINAEEYNAALFSGRDSEGHLWGVPHAMNSIAILYNKDLFDKYNVPYPADDWTFDDLYETAAKLTHDEDGDGETDVYGIMLGSNITLGWLPFFYNEGVDPLKENGTQSNALDAKVKAAYEEYYSYYKNGYAPTRQVAAKEGTDALVFCNELVAMTLVQSDTIKEINANLYDNFEYGVAAMPYGKDGKRVCVYVPNQWSIYSGETDQQKGAAWEFLKYYLSEEAQHIVAKYCLTGFPIKTSALEAVEEYKPWGETDTAPFYKHLDEFGRTVAESPCWSEWRTKYDNVCGQIQKGEELTDEMIVTLDQDVQEILDYYYN